MTVYKNSHTPARDECMCVRVACDTLSVSDRPAPSMTGDLVIVFPLLVILGAPSPVSCSDPAAASASSGVAGEAAVMREEVGVKVYELQADVWAPTSLDVFLRYNLSQKGFAASSEVSVCTRVKPSSFTPLEPYISMAASDVMSDSLLIYRRGGKNSFYYNNSKRQNWFPNLTTEMVLHQWFHYCHIFSTGWYRAYVEGEERVRGYLQTQVAPLPLNSTLTIGQEQDVVGGGFDLSQVFRGHVAQVNIWNRSLTQREVEDMASCRRHVEGNVFSSDHDELENFGASVETVKLRKLCEEVSSFVIFPEPRDLEASKLMCHRVGYVIYGPRTAEENRRLHNTSLQFVETCAANFILWVGLTDAAEEGTWRRFSDDEVVNDTSFQSGQPNGDTEQNCLFMAKGSGLWVDVFCPVDMLACVPCTKRQDPPLRLRGLCSRREPETYYEVLGYSSGKPYFHGFYGFMIYTVGQGEWHLKDTKKGEVVLASLRLTSSNSYPVGRNVWTISAAVCGIFSGTGVELSLSACDDTQFTCANGDCIPKERRCDLRDDCSDHTDESDCSLVQMPESYRSGRPPDSAVDGAAVDLTAVVHILRFMEIDDITRTARLEMTVDIMWKDVRLKYLNLKEAMEGNRLSSREMGSVWRPSLEFPNLYDGNIKLQKEAVSLLKTGQPLPSDFNDVKMDTMYLGESALLVQKQHYIGTFACRFDMFYYPFDTQRCSALLQLSSVSVEVVAFSEDRARVEYLGDKDLPSYIITKYQVLVTRRANNNSTSYSVLSVEFELQRRWLVIVLGVFLPTTLLLLIGYSTLFVRVDRLQVRLTVSLTTLLVLYTLFNNTSDALPVTAYVKMIDMWFLYCIFLLFLISICHVFVEHLEIRSKVIKVRPFHYTPPRLTPENVLQASRCVLVPTFVVIFNVVYWSLLLTSS